MRLSVITINFNNCGGLRRTIESVIAQTYKNFEYIVIDGASTDGSRDVILEHSVGISYWVSEPDTGIYNAMNKGIRASKGEYLLFINSGDYLITSDILETVMPELKDTPVVYGNGMSEDNKGKRTAIKIPGVLKLDYFSSNSLCHPSAFISRELFDIYGLYNESNKIVSDWEFFLKTIMVHDVKTRKINYEISVVEDNGISRDIANRQLLMEEVDNTLRRYFPPAVIELISDYKKMKSYVDALTAPDNNESGGQSVVSRVAQKISRWKKKE